MGITISQGTLDQSFPSLLATDLYLYDYTAGNVENATLEWMTGVKLSRVTGASSLRCCAIFL